MLNIIVVEPWSEKMLHWDKRHARSMHSLAAETQCVKVLALSPINGTHPPNVNRMHLFTSSRRETRQLIIFCKIEQK